jgi:hypothetical protein
MNVSLSNDHYLMLEILSDGPLSSSPELDRYTERLAAMSLIARDADAKWKITRLGEAMLERQHAQLH